MNRKPFFIFSALLLSLALIFNFFKSLQNLGQFEIQLLQTRRSFYSSAFLGRLFENKVTYSVNRVSQNVFELLDINRYFFASHPRERVGIKEFSLFNFFLLPFFIFGLSYASRFRLLGIQVFFIALSLGIIIGSSALLSTYVLSIPIGIFILNGFLCLKNILSPLYS
jgi:hypothetical protein